MGHRGHFRRSPPRREPRRRILVLCEGRVTEYDYFSALRRATRNRLLEVKIERRGGTPGNLVERAARAKSEAEMQARRQSDEFLRYDEVWCVCDVDQHADLPGARQVADREEIEMAVSNPCFELWALLHFQEQTSHVEPHHALRLLRSHLPGYDKHLPFERLQATYQAAVERARQLDRRCQERGCPGENPSTGVYRLTETIRREAEPLAE